MTNQPRIIPPYVTAGQSEEEIVIEYPVELPEELMTITVYYPGSSKAKTQRVPTSALGKKAVRAKLPSFDRYGLYTILPKFPANEDPNFPPFHLRVLSSVEALLYALAPEEDPYHATASQTTNAVVAALFAYLIQNEQQGLEEDNQLIDKVLAQVVSNLDKPIVSIAEFLCGQYISPGESFLHFCIRHKYLETIEEFNSISQYTAECDAFQMSLSMKGYDGKTPLELSEGLHLDRLTSTIHKALASKDSKEGKPRKHDYKPKIKPKIKKFKDVIKRLIQDDSERVEKKQCSDVSPSLLEHLKVTALYSAEVVKPYNAVDNDFGTVSLKVGDHAFVTREENASGWCTGIVDDKYCRFPINVLKRTSYKQMLSNAIPQPLELVNSQEIHDLEDLESLVDQHQKYVKYYDEKRQHHVKSQSHDFFTPVIRTCSVETGLDELSNCSPLMKKRPLPPPSLTSSIGKHTEQKSHRQVPLPSTPNQEDSDSGDDYEKVEVPGPAELPQRPSRFAGTNPKSAQSPVQSPVLRNKLPPIRPPIHTKVNYTADGKRESAINTGTFIPSRASDCKRDSAISTTSSIQSKASNQQRSYNRDSAISTSSSMYSKASYDERRQSVTSTTSSIYVSTSIDTSEFPASTHTDDEDPYDDTSCINRQGGQTVETNVKKSETFEPKKPLKHNYVNVVEFLGEGSKSASPQQQREPTPPVRPSQPKPTPPPKHMKPILPRNGNEQKLVAASTYPPLPPKNSRDNNIQVYSKTPPPTQKKPSKKGTNSPMLTMSSVASPSSTSQESSPKTVKELHKIFEK